MARVNGISPADTPYLAQLNGMPSSIVFIMGCHRSGTSLLHHLLAYTGQVNYVTTYDVVHYDSLLFNRVTGCEAEIKAALQRRLGAEKDRGLDRLPVGVDLPEEYRFILTTFDIPMGWQARRRIDEIFAPHLTARTLDKFVELCRKKHFLAPNDQPLVLKDPADYYFNFFAVHQMLSQAKFIFIHRHPLPVLNSYLQSFGALMDRKSTYWALLDPGYAGFFDRLSIKRMLASISMRSNWYARLVLERLIASFRYYLDNISRLPEDRYAVLRYEDLCQDPGGCLSSLSTRLNLNLRPRVPPDFVEPRKLNVLPRAIRQYRKQHEALRPYLEHCRYELYP